MELAAAIESTAESDTSVAPLVDSQRVASEFARIMHASGFGDRVIVGTIPRFPRESPFRSPRSQHRTAWPGTRIAKVSGSARVRSPPAG